MEDERWMCEGEHEEGGVGQFSSECLGVEASEDIEKVRLEHARREGGAD